MARRPIFSPDLTKVGVIEKTFDFKWHSGISPEQKKKSILDLHKSANHCGLKNILEISSKSELRIGIQLSAFNLSFITKKKKVKLSVECAFHASKYFEFGGPYTDLLFSNSLAAKRDRRLKTSGDLKGFRFFNLNFPLLPRTYFYDWLYINTLLQNKKLAEDVLFFENFSDIEFNPQKSINCQAHALALYISLYKLGMLKEATLSPADFLQCCYSYYHE